MFLSDWNTSVYISVRKYLIKNISVIKQFKIMEQRIKGMMMMTLICIIEWIPAAMKINSEVGIL